MSKLDDLCKSLEIAVHARLEGYKPETDKPKDKRWPHFAWRVTLSRGDRSHTTDYRTGIGHAKKLPAPGHFAPMEHDSKRLQLWLNKPGVAVAPTAADVLSSLLSDAQSGMDTFEDFCGNLGYDTDSRAALDTYLACQATVAPLRRLLGEHWKAVAEAAGDH